MYKLNLVKRKRRIRRVAVLTGIGGMGVTSMGIVAFLGREVGTFTVNLDNTQVSLTMDTSSSFENRTTYLNASGLTAFAGAHKYRWFDVSQTFSFEKIHDETTTVELGRENSSKQLMFFKYTFFIMNDGNVNATYDMNVNFMENIKPKNDAYPMDEYLRLMIFEGDSDRYIYARRSLTRNESENGSYREYVSGAPNSGDYYGETIPFIDEMHLARLENYLEPGEKRMYTFLFWLEGNDPECTGKVPENASLRIGATINAYPYTEK